MAGVETDENGNIAGFNPTKFAMGFLEGSLGSKAVVASKYAIMRRMEAKKNNQTLYKVLKDIDESPKYGSKMHLIGTENLNADTLAYALAKNKRIGINKLDPKIAAQLGYKYPDDVRRTIQPDEMIHTLERHGENSELVQKSGQKPVTLEEISKYQEYADSAPHKGLNKDNSNNKVLVSIKELEGGFYVVIEQIRKGQNELSYKNMYFENGDIKWELLGERLTNNGFPASS